MNACVIDWFSAWPAEALKAVAAHVLAEVELPEAHREPAVQFMVAVHQSVQVWSRENKNNNTPNSRMFFFDALLL